MQPTAKRYEHDADYERVGQFLVSTYGSTGTHANWLQPRWEYMHYHPLIRRVDLASIGIWEAQGEIVGVAHPEHAMGTAYFQDGRGVETLRGEMLRHAEEHISTTADSVRRLRIHIDDADDGFQRIASEAGYRRVGGGEAMSSFVIPSPFPAVPLPPGFRLKSLADDNDLRKVTRVLWRGFDHGDEPPDDGLADRRLMQSAPNYRRELSIVVEAPDGSFVSYCGMWYEPVHSVAYVEPVATDPACRRMGLGRAVVMEGIRRCGALGATLAWVGTAKPFYLSLGFRPVRTSSVWEKAWR